MRAIEVLWVLFGVLSLLWMNSDAQKQHRLWEQGFSDQYRSENTLGQYAFGYNEDHTSGGSFRREIGDEFGNKIGSYGLRVSDGRLRIVNYVADENGYRADVLSNEPGLAARPHSAGVGVSRPQSLEGVAVPGFSYAADAPRVVFGARLMTESSPNDWDDDDRSNDEYYYAQASAPEPEAVVTEPTTMSDEGTATAASEVSVAVTETGEPVVTATVAASTSNSTEVVDLESAA